MSLSSIKDRRQLARRVRRFPALVRAVNERELGYEAARLVARVATRTTVDAWIARARERTLVHLREEIDAAELVARLTEQSVVLPPTDEVLHEVTDLERRVITGQIFPNPSTVLAVPIASDPRARVTLRLRVRESTACDYRRLEATFLRHRSSSSAGTFLHF